MYRLLIQESIQTSLGKWHLKVAIDIYSRAFFQAKWRGQELSWQRSIFLSPSMFMMTFLFLRLARSWCKFFRFNPLSFLLAPRFLLYGPLYFLSAPATVLALSLRDLLCYGQLHAWELDTHFSGGDEQRNIDQPKVRVLKIFEHIGECVHQLLYWGLNDRNVKARRCHSFAYRWCFCRRRGWPSIHSHC